MTSENTAYSAQDFDIHFKGYSLKARSLKSPSVDAGRPVLVFLHDSLGCVELWRDFPLHLAQATHCNVLVYDRQGYGQSSPFGSEERDIHYLEKEAELIPAILKKSEVEQAILFGHSDGGSIALVAAALYPKLIRAIITEGAHVFVEEITLQGIQQAVETYHSTNLPEKLARYHGDKTEAVFKAWTQTWLSADFKDWNIESYLPQIHCPVLAIQGTADEYGSEEQVDAIVMQAGGQSVKWMVPGIGHSPHKEAPEAVLEFAARFVNEKVLR
jgi:pimeloyl-ACP methyl ester carboxylesterase